MRGCKETANFGGLFLWPRS